MKKLLTIAIVFGLFLSLLGSVVVVSAQEGTQPEPTESLEPVGDSDGDGVLDDADLCPDTPEGTEVGEDGCPVEPTVEPTEEPTAEPTEEPTVEPTEEPTAEPTEEPTVEPTEEPTPVPPTEEPTMEPTEEPTPVPTEEPTATPVPTVGAAEGVEAAADVGSWTTEMIAFANLGSSASTGKLELFKDGNTTAFTTIDLPSIPATSGYVIGSSALPDGRFSGIVSSDQLLGVVVLNTNYTLGGADMYDGFSNNVANKLTVPLIYRHWTPTGSRWTTRFHVQNTEGTSAPIYINLYRSGSSSPDVVRTDTIAGYNSQTYDVDGSEYSAFGDYFGYAVVTSTNQIAVVADAVRNPSGSKTADRVVTTYEGLPDSAAGRDLVAPLIYSNHSTWLTGVNVVNLGNVSSRVVMTITKSGPPPNVGAKYTFEKNIAAHAEDTFYMPDLWPQGLPQPLYGTAELHSESANILAAISSSKYVSAGSVGNISAALNPSIATTKVAGPFYFRRYGSSDWITGANIWNTGGATTINVTLVKDPSSPGAATINWSKSVGANQPITFYAMDAPGMTDGWFGSIFVTSTDNRSLMMLLTHSGYARGVSTNNLGINY